MEKHHLLPERMMMKFQILWRILMKLPRMKQTELSQLLKKKNLEEVTLEETHSSCKMPFSTKMLKILPIILFFFQ